MDELEPAKAGLTEVMPTTRMPGGRSPTRCSISRWGSTRARALMPAWRGDLVEREWMACDHGIDESLRRARRLREEAPDLGGFEGLIWAVEELLAPLEVFGTCRRPLP